MKIKFIGAVTVIFIVAGLTSGQKLEPPKLDPTPATESQKQIIKEGVALHDQGDYDGAISRYKEVLRENPANVMALYELSFSYFLKKDCKKSLEAALNAAQYKSDLLGEIYGEIGNCQDDLGKPKEAIETYQAGIKLLPANYLLPYNLGLTYARLGQFEEARASLKKSASLNPNHSSSHHVLSIAFDKGSYKTPALLAACRFLILEPKTRRSDVTLGLVQKIMQAGVSQKSSNEISVVMTPPGKKDEGDFDAIDLFVSLLKAGNYTEKNKGKSEMQLLVGNFESLFGIISESQEKWDGTKFAWKYYAPYFAELKKQGHTEAFVYYIHQSGNDFSIYDWLNQNPSKVTAFVAWSKSYKWPKTD